MSTPKSDVKLTTEDKAIHAFVQKTFDPSEISKLYNYIRLNHDVRLTRHYTIPGKPESSLPIGEIPSLHRYHITSDQDPHNLPGGGIPANTVTVKCPTIIHQFLPEDIKAFLKSNGVVDLKSVTHFFTTHNLPWGPGTKILFRPHYFIYGYPALDKALAGGTFNPESVSMKCNLKYFSFVPNSISNQNPNTMPISVCSHPGTPKALPSMIICSPGPDKNPIAAGLTHGIDFENSQCVISVVITPGLTTAITLHWILNAADQDLINNISFEANNLADFIVAIEKLGDKTKLNAPNGPVAALRRFLHIEKLDCKNLMSKIDKKVIFDNDQSNVVAQPMAGDAKAAVDNKPNVSAKPMTGDAKVAVDNSKSNAIAKPKVGDVKPGAVNNNNVIAKPKPSDAKAAVDNKPNAIAKPSDAKPVAVNNNNVIPKPKVSDAKAAVDNKPNAIAKPSVAKPGAVNNNNVIAKPKPSDAKAAVDKKPNAIAKPSVAKPGAVNNNNEKSSDKNSSADKASNTDKKSVQDNSSDQKNFVDTRTQVLDEKTATDIAMMHSMETSYNPEKDNTQLIFLSLIDALVTLQGQTKNVSSNIQKATDDYRCMQNMLIDNQKILQANEKNQLLQTLLQEINNSLDLLLMIQTSGLKTIPAKDLDAAIERTKKEIEEFRMNLQPLLDFEKRFELDINNAKKMQIALEKEGFNFNMS